MTCLCLDTRAKKAQHLQTTYHPHLVEDFSPVDGYELVLVCVKRNQLHEVLPSLAQQSGNADILFLQNNWSGRAEIERSLPLSRYLLGFPSAGGGRDQQGIQCALGPGTRLGEVDIIAEKDDVIYFVEVKTRREQDFLEGYSHQQRDRLLKIASEYIATRNHANRQVSFLLIGITGNPGEGDFKVEAVEDCYID